MSNSTAINYFFALANILFFISVFPSLLALWKNREVLKGFSLSGAVMTTIGLLFMYAGYLSYGLYLNVLLSVPLFLYWGAVAYYCIKRRIKDAIPSHELR